MKKSARAATLLTVALLSGCISGTSPGELSKALEHQYYDELARVFSQYCADFSSSMVMAHTRIEMSREIRQNGSRGPAPPSGAVRGIAYKKGDVNNLKPELRYGEGPVVMVWCNGDYVPAEVWTQLDRYWAD